MKYITSFALYACMTCLLTAAGWAQDGPQQGVVVTINNTSGVNSTFQTPIWVGFHNGTFDIYDRNAPASMLPIPDSIALERLAEDGNTGPISDDFAALVPDGVQATILSNTTDLPPLAPRARVSRLFRVDPNENRYFSYASMVIPSNDAFVANGNPLAHQVFDDQGQFVAERFDVLGTEVLDAGTEVNDEIPENTAFFGQTMPNTGVDENATVELHPGFLPPELGGILADPMFANADFLQPGFRNLLFRFRTINIDRPNRFNGMLDIEQEIPAPDVDGNPFGFALTRTNSRNDSLAFLIIASGLSGRPSAAHLHVGLSGRTGEVVVDLLDNGRIFGFRGQFFIFGEVGAADVVGPLANSEVPFDGLLGELATNGVYVNIHTKQNPAGEIRGQLSIRR